MSRLPSLRLSASELVEQLQAESSPSPRMPTTPASGSRGRFRSPGTGTAAGSSNNKFLSSTFSPSRSTGGSGQTTPSTLSPQRNNMRSRTESPGGGGRGGVISTGTLGPGSVFGSGGQGRSMEAELSPRRPLVRGRLPSAAAGAGAAATAASGEGLEEAEEAPYSPGPSGGVAGAGADLARRFFFGATAETSPSPPPNPPPEKQLSAAAAAAEPSTLPSSPQGSFPPPLRGHTKSVSSSGSIGEGSGWAET
ncbi:unnamed protein product, partial [Ectocarpus sp. 13 AM-2016]